MASIIRLIDLNSQIKMGKALFALRTALLLLVFQMILNLGPEVIRWLLYRAWMYFAVYYAIGLIVFSGLWDKALDVSRKIKGTKVAEERPATRLDYAFGLAVFLLLATPSITVYTTNLWLENRLDVPITVRLGTDYANGQTLTIPRGYFSQDIALEYWMGKTGIPPNHINITARLFDMQYLPRESPAYKEMLKNPAHSPTYLFTDIVDIRVINSANTYTQLIDQFKPNSFNGLADAGGISFNLDYIKPKQKYGLNMESVGSFVFATPLDEKEKAVIFCQGSCSIFTKIDGISMVQARFHNTELKNWKLILKHSTTLIKRFSNNKLD